MIGTYAKAGKAPCSECPRNTMQDKTGQSVCGGCSTGYGGSNKFGVPTKDKYVISGAGACLFQCNRSKKTKRTCYK